MLANATVADLFRPDERSYAVFYDIALILGGSLLIALCTQVKILLPFSPVPITGQTFAVLMLGALLGSRRGSLSVLLYLAEGAAGLPIFALGGGWPILLGPTGGYLFGFIPAAYLVGLLAEKGWDRRVSRTILAMILGNLVLYTCGLFWLSCWVGFNGLLIAGLYPFIIGDFLKIVLAAVVLPTGWKLLSHLKSDLSQREETGS